MSPVSARTGAGLPVATPGDDAEVALALQGIHKAFGEHRVLDGVDFEVRRGEVVGLIGPGGAGKSVLTKVCCGLLPPDSGQIAVLGADLLAMTERHRQRLRERIGLVFQNYALFDFMTVAENIAFPMRQRGGVSEAEIDAKVRSRLDEVDLARAYGQMPGELSGGMKKRVGLARAIINDPELVFFDDPTAGLDPVTSSKIFELIRRSQSELGATCLVISHDIDRMRAACDRYLLLLDGRIAWAGTADDAAAADDPVVEEFFRAKSEFASK